jgi:hypothetical protein
MKNVDTDSLQPSERNPKSAVFRWILFTFSALFCGFLTGTIVFAGENILLCKNELKTGHESRGKSEKAFLHNGLAKLQNSTVTDSSLSGNYAFYSEDGLRCKKESLVELLAPKQSFPGRRFLKFEKQYPVLGRPARNIGLAPLVTTLFNAHLKESLPLFSRPAPLEKTVSRFFRCRGFGFETSMDPRLIKIIMAAAKEFKSQRVTIISAYRSPKFNDTLAKKGRRVALESKHTKGEAVDFRLDTVRAKILGPWLFKHFDGGVGTYVNNDFVHVDVGPKRRWRGR